MPGTSAKKKWHERQVRSDPSNPITLLNPVSPTTFKHQQVNKGVDWSKVEAEYRAGIISVREIAARHRIPSESTIRKRAAKQKWTRDLTAAVQAAVSAKNAGELAGLSAPLVSAMSDDEMVEHASNTVVQVQKAHRDDIKELRERTMRLGRFIDEVVAVTEKQGDLKKEHLLALGKDGLIGAHESISRSYDRVANLERKAYGIDRGPVDPTPEKAGSTLERVLNKLVGPAGAGTTPPDEEERA